MNHEEQLAEIYDSEAYLQERADDIGVNIGRDGTGDNTTWWWEFTPKGLAMFGDMAWTQEHRRVPVDMLLSCRFLPTVLRVSFNPPYLTAMRMPCLSCYNAAFMLALLFL
jgi:hypothetical protein